MRINLDEPVPDEPLQPAGASEDETEDEASAESMASDEIIIRRDTLTKRRRRTGPKPLTPQQQRAIVAFLVLVIVMAVTSLGVYVRNVRETARRIPVVRTQPPPAQLLQAPQRVVPQRPAGPPIYQGPPPRNDQPLEEGADADTSTPAEGIH